MNTQGTTLILPVLDKVFSDIPNVAESVEKHLENLAKIPTTLEELKERLETLTETSAIMEESAHLREPVLSLAEVGRQFVRVPFFVSASDDDFV
jgi:hypothetical protein